jgi:signal peptide peptidase SppA
MNKYPRLLQAFYDTPWAILPSKLGAIHAFLTRAAFLGLDVEDALLSPAAVTEEQRAEWQASAAAAAARAGMAKGSAVAVIQVLGTIANRGSNLEGSGGTSVVAIQRALRAALADDSIGAIVLDIDSPGGSVYGVDELAGEIYAAREQKKIIAVANHLAASAAYYLGVQATEFYAPPTAEVGSIGVWALHLDWSAHLEKEGIKPTIISFGKNKVEGNPFQPISEDTLAHKQARVDEYGAMFIKSVARARGLTGKQVRENFGDGRMFGAAEAKERGLIDGLKTFDQVLQKLGVNTGSPSASAATPAVSGAAAVPPASSRPSSERATESVPAAAAAPAAAVKPSVDSVSSAASALTAVQAARRRLDLERLRISP